MKKLLAILLSALLLCSMMAVTTVVSAADVPTVVLSIVDGIEEVEPGDEFQVQVDLLNLDQTTGLIAALVKIEYDTDAIELVTYYDEDEEADMNMIEIGSKYNASSNKYITFGPLGYCSVFYKRATASASQVRTEEHFFTATFRVKEGAASGSYDLTAVFGDKDFVQYGTTPVAMAKENTSITVKGEEPACEHEYAYDCSKVCSKCNEETRPEAAHQYFYACDPVCMICYELTNPEAAHSPTHVEAKPATCTENGNIEYWFCEACGGCWDNENATGMPLNRFMVIIPMAEHEYTYACDKICVNCGAEREASHTIVAVDALEPTCTEIGNVAYWYCSDCGAAWLDAECTIVTNLQAVKLGASCKYGAVYTAAKDATCDEPGNIEYWYCANCDVYYADADCTIITNAKNVIIPITHSIEYVAAKAASCTEAGNIEYWYCADCGQAWLDEYCHLNTNLKSVILPASCSYGAVYTAAKEATCYEPGNTEYWYCANCDVYYADAACAIVTNAKNVIIPITHKLAHVAAKAATCTEAGNIEYWYCEDCGQAWLDELCHLNTNLKSVILPASCSYGAQYVEAKAATCFEPGNTEYWYCANCDVYYADAACAIVTNAKNVIIPITHNIIAVAAKAPTCTETGNIAYWYCADCGQAWLDELCHLNTNLKAVILPEAGHTYTNAHDASCDVCGEIRDIVLSADQIIIEAGNSVSELKSGLAYKFDVAADGVVISEDYIADYSNATVTINGVAYKLINMGVVSNNKGYANQTLDDVDGKYVQNVEAIKAFEIDGTLSFAVRVLNIPSDKLDAEIIVRSYYTYENAEGELITVYGEDWSASYNAVLNG